jgi:hypothetical protein
MAARQAEHGTTGSSCAVTVEKEDASGRTAVQPLVSGCAAPGDRAHVVPTVEVKAAVGWCGLARRSHHDGPVVGEHAVAVETNVGGRRGREGDVREPRRSWWRSAITVTHVFFLICGDRNKAEDVDKNGLDVESINRGPARTDS